MPVATGDARRAKARALIDASPLPDEIRSLVADVVARTGGRGAERADLARELLAHFEDALRDGGSPEEAIAAFGDPATAARLLRRAMLRKRGPLSHAWRWTLRATGALILLLATGYGYAWLRYNASSPTISIDGLALLRELAPLGEPDERAWPAIREAVRAIRDDEQAFYDAARASGDTRGDLFTSHAPGDAGWDEAGRIVTTHAAAIAALRAATTRPLLGAGVEQFEEVDRAFFGPMHLSGEFDARRGLLSVRLPSLMTVRQATRWLAVDARHALAADDPTRFVDDIEAMVRLSELVRGPLVIEQLVAAAILDSAVAELLRGLERHGARLSESDLVRLANALASLPPERFRPDFRGERVMYADFVQRVYTDDGQGDGHLVGTMLAAQDLQGAWGAGDVRPLIERVAAPLAAMTAPSRREFLARIDAALATAEARAAEPTWAWTAHDESDESGVLAQLHGLLGLDALIPRDAYAGAVHGLRRVEHRRDLAALVVALARHRADRGAWPDSLDELVPAYLDAIPPDPYDGRPLRYALLNGGPSLWSIGPDRVEHGFIASPAYAALSHQTWHPPGAFASEAADVRLWPVPSE